MPVADLITRVCVPEKCVFRYGHLKARRALSARGSHHLGDHYGNATEALCVRLSVGWESGNKRRN